MKLTLPQNMDKYQGEIKKYLVIIMMLTVGTKFTPDSKTHFIL